MNCTNVIASITTTTTTPASTSTATVATTSPASQSASGSNLGVISGGAVGVCGVIVLYCCMRCYPSRLLADEGKNEK